MFYQEIYDLKFTYILAKQIGGFSDPKEKARDNTENNRKKTLELFL